MAVLPIRHLALSPTLGYRPCLAHRVSVSALCRPRLLVPARRAFAACPARPAAPPAPLAPPPSTKANLAAHVGSALELPVFQAQASQLRVLRSPPELYAQLRHLISHAERTIYLASLYIGPSETELLDTLRASLRAKPDLRLVVLVDYLRGTREPPPQASGASALASLVGEFPSQVDVRMWRTPRYGGLFALAGKRLNEGAGLQHMKLYAADDTVLISGANLSRDYFTNRQDRYMEISHAGFAAYVRGLIDQIALHSFVLQPQAGPELYSLTWPAQAKETRPSVWAHEAQQGLVEFTRATAQEQSVSPTRGSEKESESEAISFTPLLQMGPYGIAHETAAVAQALAWLQGQDQQGTEPSQPRAKLHLTSGYFSIEPRLAAAVVQGTYPTSIIAASPRANGFFGSKGLSGFLADAYTLLAWRFWKRLVRAGRAGRCEGEGEGERKANVVIHEWEREGWTYHAKGLWLVPRGSRAPAHTFIGSSNFGGRSAHTDLECTLLISAPGSQAVQGQLAAEQAGLAAYATRRFDGALVERERGQLGRRVDSLVVRFGTWLLRKNM